MVAVPDGTTISLDSDLINRVKAHLLVTYLPDDLDGEDAQAYREWMLRLWIDVTLWEQLQREGSQFVPSRQEEIKSKKKEIGLQALPPYDTHL